MQPGQGCPTFELNRSFKVIDMIWTMVKFVANKTSQNAISVLMEIARFMNSRDLEAAADYLLFLRKKRFPKPVD